MTKNMQTAGRGTLLVLGLAMLAGCGAEATGESTGADESTLVAVEASACDATNESNRITCELIFFAQENRCYVKFPYCEDPTKPGCGDPIARAGCLDSANGAREMCLDAAADAHGACRYGVPGPFPYVPPPVRGGLLGLPVTQPPSLDPCAGAYLDDAARCAGTWREGGAYCDALYDPFASCAGPRANCNADLFILPNMSAQCVAEIQACRSMMDQHTACLASVGDALKVCLESARERRARCAQGLPAAPDGPQPPAPGAPNFPGE